MVHNQELKPSLWRKGKEPMQIIYGANGRKVLHYEAPLSAIVQAVIEKFNNGCNNPELQVNDNISKALLKSAITHLHFETQKKPYSAILW
jgi:hypothetical protein